MRRRADLETKVLKQLVRDIIQPERDLGHSDRKTHKALESQESGSKTTDNLTTEKTAEEKKTSGRNTASQFRDVSEQACKECQ